MGTTCTRGPIRIKQPKIECNHNTILFMLFTLLIKQEGGEKPTDLWGTKRALQVWQL